MGLREWWNRLMGRGDEGRPAERAPGAPTETPPPLEDYQEMRDERAREERPAGTQRPDSDVTP